MNTHDRKTLRQQKGKARKSYKRGTSPNKKPMSLFESILNVSAQEIELELHGFKPVPWDDFLLNPRRLRGSDFLMRWTQGQWSEERLTQALEQTQNFFAVPYGPSGTAPDDDVRAFELYFERLEAAGLGKVKRPDLLIFQKSDDQAVRKLLAQAGGIAELPFTREDDPIMRELVDKSLLAIECENSLWRAKQMPDFGTKFSPQKRLQGNPGLKKSAVLPTIIIKDEDRAPLKSWQKQHGKKIHVWHVFYDLAYGIALDEAERLIKDNLIEPTVQVFQAPGGATTRKVIFKFYYQYAYPLGESNEEPTLIADYVSDKNGHILPYVKFHGGQLTLAPQALDILKQASTACQ